MAKIGGDSDGFKQLFLKKSGILFFFSSYATRVD